MTNITEMNADMLDLVNGGGSITFTAAADGTLTTDYAFGDKSGSYSFKVPAEVVQRTGSITFGN